MQENKQYTKEELDTNLDNMKKVIMSKSPEEQEKIFADIVHQINEQEAAKSK